MSKFMPPPSELLLSAPSKHGTTEYNTDRNPELNKISTSLYWDLASAVIMLQHLAPAAYKAGYNLALFGGVLHNGFSDKNLDVIAIPRCTKEDIHNRQELLNIFNILTPPRHTLMGPRRQVYSGYPELFRPPVDLVVLSKQQTTDA